MSKASENHKQLLEECAKTIFLIENVLEIIEDLIDKFITPLEEDQHVKNCREVNGSA
ncbi:MAG: hypothetical protein AVDCRST_MAG96-1597 [uncultured Segetibacter sp.]|uniref:Uncharacterized protein n=1 Tax=uncultured Segetibacter sp. TaxID=481133 RepID=A0A6J4SGA7_9BACT|nr:MAG: hypothetical protein AVDCRST_MAG96-1597 [uncultured Segetibacter sp.]